MSDAALGSDWSSIYRDLQEEQKKPRKNYSRILSLSSQLVTHHARSMGQNIWEVYEALVLASLDCSHYEITKSALSKLSARFPKSVRVLVMKGMLLEAQGLTEEALALYQDILTKEPLNRECRRRKVSVHKSKGQTKMAIQELCKYLTLFIGDTEAWLELCDLYTQELDLYNAGFCIEELILTNPLSYLNHLKYAEICYTKGEEYWDTAAKHYTQTLVLKRDCPRALFGVILTFYAIMRASKQSLQSKERKMVEWAKGMLLEMYRGSGNGAGERMLQNTISYFDK